MSRAVLLLLFSAGGLTGCLTPGPVHVPAANPIFVPVPHEEVVWERTVDVIHAYHFPIARENRLDGVIETEYFTGSSVLEPWHPDSVGLAERLESTFQSIRRRLIVSVTPVEGGYLIGVEAFKELEDLPGEAALTPGGATFQEHRPLERNLDLVLGQSTPSGWILLGRDANLEAALLRTLQSQF